MGGSIVLEYESLHVCRPIAISLSPQLASIVFNVLRLLLVESVQELLEETLDGVFLF